MVFVAQNRSYSKEVFGFTVEGMRERAKEDDMGFGQTVAVLLLILPVMTFVATYYGTSQRAASGAC